MGRKRRSHEELLEAETGEKPYWVGDTQRGRRLTVKQIMAVFCAWLESEQNIAATCDATGVAKNTVVKLINEGGRGVPPFEDLIGMVEFNTLVASIGHDVSLRGYRWSPRKAIAQMLQVCDGLRKKLRDTIESNELKIRNWKEAIEVAKAIPVLEAAYGKMAEKFGLDIETIWDKRKKSKSDGPDKESLKEVPDVPESREPSPNFAEMSADQIKEWIATQEGSEPREQVG